MRPEDLRIWERFIELAPSAFDSVWCDWHLGECAQFEEGADPRAMAGWYDLTRWKVDVIGYKNGTYYVIELKPGANAKALGQALAYTALIKDETYPNSPVIPVVLTNERIPSTDKAAKLFGVELWVVEFEDDNANTKNKESDQTSQV